MGTRLLGIDIGGSGIKGAPVDLERGVLAAERLRIETPHPAEPEPVARVLAEIVGHFGWTGPVGVTFPGVVADGVTLSAANVSRKWLGLHAQDLFAAATGRDVTVVNDADAAGIAEMRHGAGRGADGTVVVLTLGTGIGSALFTHGVLVPNTEFGHLEINGRDAESRASARVRDEEGLSWDKWAHRLSRYLRRLEALLSPSLIVLGGGVSKKSDKFVPLLKGVRAPVVPAALVNDAGIVGAAMAAADGAAAVRRRGRLIDQPAAFHTARQAARGDHAAP
ncbi:polyphosphate--glucose phosphotransferase [Actinomadura sp. NBRC 104425]|uniref:polyphosphate--glucose phosphotransferase n=1 Tax=Actinomadura sp. NBRC 104425 TaxID=3032204 RepID=UPI0025562E1A|nr:ROK family protein [Actinomadura sp. NBRC 104425]